MDRLAMLAALVCTLIPATASSEMVVQITPNDLKSYCVYEDRIYSLGAFVCLGGGGGQYCGRKIPSSITGPIPNDVAPVWLAQEAMVECRLVPNR